MVTSHSDAFALFTYKTCIEEDKGVECFLRTEGNILIHRIGGERNVIAFKAFQNLLVGSFHAKRVQIKLVGIENTGSVFLAGLLDCFRCIGCHTQCVFSDPEAGLLNHMVAAIVQI